MRGKHSLRKIWKIADNKALFVLQILMTMGLSAIAIYISNFAKNIVDSGINDSEFIILLLKFIGITFIGIGLNYLVVITQSKFSRKFVYKLRALLVDRLLNCAYGYYENEHSGSINNKLTFDMNAVSSYISGGLSEFISGIITFLCCFTYLLTINLSMALVIAICIPITVALAAIISSPTYHIMDNFEQKMGDVANIATDTVNGSKIEKAYNIQQIRVDEFNHTMNEATSYYVNYEKLVAKSGPYKYIIKSAPTFICIIIGFYNAYRGTITNGDLIAFILLLHNVSNPLSELARYVTELKGAMVSMDKILEIIDLSDETFGTENINSHNSSTNMTFELKDVSFTYGKELSTVLSHINLSIPIGKTIAIVGASGCGKSTLFKLLLGFHIPTDGEVLLYGMNLNNLDIEKARAQISYVSQNTYLFNKTVAENIGLGKADATFEEIVVAARKAYAHEFIMELPQGYQTVLSEGGQNLSGGQKQRLSIAMAFLKDAPIFILDEMTSALDVESEKLIQQAIDDYKENKTVIIIAHRLSTIQNADEIFVLNDGQIAESGTHQQLLTQNGVYSHLYKNQPVDAPDITLSCDMNGGNYE